MRISRISSNAGNLLRCAIGAGVGNLLIFHVGRAVSSLRANRGRRNFGARHFVAAEAGSGKRAKRCRKEGSCQSRGCSTTTISPQTSGVLAHGVWDARLESAECVARNGGVFTTSAEGSLRRWSGMADRDWPIASQHLRSVGGATTGPGMKVEAGNGKKNPLAATMATSGHVARSLDQAAFDFATCVAIASISAGDRQS